MARTLINPLTLTSSFYPATPVDAGSLDLLETAVDDPTDRYCVLLDGKTMVLAHNTDSVDHNVTVSSVRDSYQRTGDITAYVVAAGKVARFGPFKSAGWANSGNLDIDVSDPKVRLSVITLP